MHAKLNLQNHIISKLTENELETDNITYWICSNLPFSHKCVCGSNQFSFQQIIMNINIKPVAEKQINNWVNIKLMINSQQ